MNKSNKENFYKFLLCLDMRLWYSGVNDVMGPLPRTS